MVEKDELTTVYRDKDGYLVFLEAGIMFALCNNDAPQYWGPVTEENKLEKVGEFNLYS